MKYKKAMTIVTSAYLALWSVVAPTKVAALTTKYLRPTCLIPYKYWTMTKIKSFAKTVMYEQYGWDRTEYKALNKLWTAESHWNPSAYNDVVGDPIDGSHAGGIPQLLALDPRTPAPQQVERGLAYISHRYGKPSIAWSHERTHGWY